jgi:hypothetical protein
VAQCECVPRCPFFNEKMAARPATADLMKKKFCLGDKQLCARYRVRSAIGPNAVPADLYPNQSDKADAVIAEQRKARP